MMRKLMIDNWTFQDVDELFASGLSGETNREIELSKDRQSHHFSQQSKGVLQIDSLLNLLTNIVLYDGLIVDKEYMYTWDKPQPSVRELVAQSLVVGVSYKTHGESLYELRKSILDELLVAPSLQALAKKFRTEYAVTGTTSDPRMGALLNGSAGMLARSYLTEMPYFGHPCRRKLISDSRMFGPQKNSRERTVSVISSTRTKVFRFEQGSIEGSRATFHLPPIAIEVIEESKSYSDLIPTAIQLRNKYCNLRKWLNKYQDVLESDDFKKQFSIEKTLSDLSSSIEASFAKTDSAETGVMMSVGWLKIPISKRPIDFVRNRFGIRAVLSNLIVAKRGHRALKQLIKMLDEEHSALGREVLNGIAERFAQTSNTE